MSTDGEALAPPAPETAITPEPEPAPTTTPSAPVAIPAPTAPTPPPLPLLLTTDAAASYIGLSRTRLYALQRSGELSGVLVGGRRRWRRADLDAYVAGLETSGPRGAAVDERPSTTRRHVRAVAS